MPEVSTVTGSVKTDRFGVTLPHEHFYIASGETVNEFPDIWDWDIVVEDTVKELRKARDLGVNTLINPTVLGTGRNMPVNKKIAEQTDINIVLATGIYTWNELPHYFQERSAQHLADLFVNAIKDGIADTGVRAAFLKTAVDHHGFTEGIQKAHKAVALAHQETGAPVMLHSCSEDRSGIEQQRIMIDNGVDPENVVIAHAGDTTDIDYLVKMADKGSYLGMDRYGLKGENWISTEKRNQTVMELVDRGYLEKIMVSHDHAVASNWMPEERWEKMSKDQDYGFVFREVFPALSELGLQEEEIETITCENTARWFE